jgi:hypothetical protein
MKGTSDMTESKHETNQNASHTPGPWRYEASTQTIRSVPANYWLATVDSFEGAVNHDTNARLIAASPALLNSLEEVVRICEAMRYTVGLGKNQLERIERAKAVVAEAKGLAA